MKIKNVSLLKPVAWIANSLITLAGFNTTYATIPAVIPANSSYTVSTSDICNGSCTVMPGAHLIIASGVGAVFNGGINVSNNASIAADNAKIAVAGDIVVNPHAQMTLHNNSVLSMYPDKRIILKPSSDLITQYNGAYLEVLNSTITAYKAPAPGCIWGGIETSRNSLYPYTYVDGHDPFVYLDHATISYAKNALTNFNTALPAAQTNGGLFQVFSTNFQNNYRSLNMYGSITTENIISTDWPFGWNAEMNFNYNNFSFTPDFVPPAGYNEMVNLNKCKNVSVWSSNFTGNTYTFGNGYAAIRGVNSSIWAQLYPLSLGAAPNTTFTSFNNAIVINNSLQSLWPVLIYKCQFNSCPNAINLSGCQNAFIVENLLASGFVADYNGIFLRNCTGYRVEGNTIQYDGDNTHQYNGIVVMNSGVANNTIYRNHITYKANLGLQSIGTNKAASELTGLKFICNNLQNIWPDNHYDITVMSQAGVTNNGVHRYQYVQGIFPQPDHSSANTFVQYPNPQPTLPINYYVEPGTNFIPSFAYKYYAPNTTQNPSLKNFTNITAIYNDNACPVINTLNAKSAPSFGSFVNQLNNIEQNIGVIENNSNITPDDTETLGALYQQQSGLIDSMVNHYVDSNRIDSLILIYQQVTKGYHYQIMLAATYAELNRYDDAINVLSPIQGRYALTDEESEQIGNLMAMYNIVAWLYQNNDDWVNLDDGYKQRVYDFEQNDNMYAGAIARALLVAYQGYTYDPIYIMPDGGVNAMKGGHIVANIENRIYPNPASATLYLDWKSTPAGIIILTDVTGRILMQQHIVKGTNEINMASLAKGMYFAMIKENGKILFQQKITKQ